jgi:uncharacterized membrane protein YkoI
MVVLAVVGAIGAASAMNAMNNTDTKTTDVQKELQEPNYVASIKAPQTDNENDKVDEDKYVKEAKDDEAQESKELAKYAKITPEDAKKSALAEVPGKVVKVSLDNENGYVVYSVEIATDTGVKDVKVDAGNGHVLYIDSNEDTEIDNSAEQE